MCYLPQNGKGSQSSLPLPTGPAGLPSSLLQLLVLASTLFCGLWVVRLMSASDSRCSLTNGAPYQCTLPLHFRVSHSLCAHSHSGKQLFCCRTLSPGFPSGSHSGLQGFHCETLPPPFHSGSCFHSGGLQRCGC